LDGLEIRQQILVRDDRDSGAKGLASAGRSVPAQVPRVSVSRQQRLEPGAAGGRRQRGGETMPRASRHERLS
jgi:hypothetical protein